MFREPGFAFVTVACEKCGEEVFARLAAVRGESRSALSELTPGPVKTRGLSFVLTGRVD